ncbi:MAG TPA: hypothetical protein VMY69_01840 [Phycisphaerae bacterium]|nr:hypothetical protein [Phycisphaerae bacterium]
MQADELRLKVQDLAERIREGGEVWRTMERLAAGLPAEIWNETTEREAGAVCLATPTVTAVRRCLRMFLDLDSALNVEALERNAEEIGDVLQAVLVVFDEDVDAAGKDGLGLAEALARVAAGARDVDAALVRAADKKPEPATAGA